MKIEVFGAFFSKKKKNMESEKYSCGEFLQLKLIKMIEKGVIWPSYPRKYKKNANGCRGISNSKKQSINSKLCPLMPQKSREF